MATYYNEFDPRAAAWLRELMADGLIPQGEVDERSIAEVRPEDLASYVQCHFFAGVGGWPLALRLAGWPDDRPCWTGSCPCQPFSAAGKRRGADDERDLWPEFFRLIEACRPPKVFGEQVASAEVVGTELEAAFLVAVQAGEFAKANKLAKQLAQSRSFHYAPRWITRVRADLETADYALWWKVLGAHSVGAPHIRQRLFWVADATGAARNGPELRHDAGGDGGIPDESGPCGLAYTDGTEPGRGQLRLHASDGSGDGSAGVEEQPANSGLEHATGNGREQGRAGADGRSVAGGCGDGGLGDSDDTGPQGRDGTELRERTDEQTLGPRSSHGGVDWTASRIIVCRDGKARRIPASAESVLQWLFDGLPGGVDDVRAASAGFPLAGKVPNRVGLLRGYGNAIVPQVAAAFIEAFMEAT